MKKLITNGDQIVKYIINIQVIKNTKICFFKYLIIGNIYFIT